MSQIALLLVLDLGIRPRSSRSRVNLTRPTGESSTCSKSEKFLSIQSIPNLTCKFDTFEKKNDFEVPKLV